jgi:negative regulator of flagellin synthesis FlgM
VQLSSQYHHVPMHAEDATPIHGSPAAAAIAQTKSSSASNPACSSAAGPAEKTSLSSTAGLLSVSASKDDARTDVVAQLRAAIQSGSYSVPTSAVADKLLSSMLSR